MSYANIVTSISDKVQPKTMVKMKSLKIPREKPKAEKPKAEKHCPICAKAGMPPEIVSSHYVRESRDPSSRVTCPIIIHNLCSKCGKKGHFATTCKVVFHARKEVITAEKPKIATSNKFCFSDSEDEESEAEAPEEIKVYKTAKEIASEALVIEWRKKYENSGLNLNILPYGVYWNIKYNQYVEAGYTIIEKVINGEKVLLAKRQRKSWADESDDSDSD